MPTQNLSPEQVTAFNKDGYIVIKNFCSKEEIKKLYNTALEDKACTTMPWI